MEHYEHSSTAKTGNAGVPSRGKLPAGTQWERLTFAAQEQGEGKLLATVKAPLPCHIYVSADESAESSTAAADENSVRLMLIPGGDPEGQEWVQAAWDWLEPGVPVELRQGHLITLQGSRVLWTAGRACIIAPANRLESLRLTVAEFCLHEGEVRKMETAVAQDWPQLEADTPLAFIYEDKDSHRREELAKRFQKAIQLRTQIARLQPVLHRPPVHPPTLASQLCERLKERTRLLERVEFLGEQVDVFERVYEMCGQRSNDHALSRKSTMLEWIIIILLATETIILLVDLMNSTGN